MSKIIGVNGIASRGQGNTDKALKRLKAHGFKVHDLNQKIRHVWNVRWHKEQDARAIVEIAQNGDAILCHSYGGIKAALAMRDVRFSAVFFFRPAMERNYRFPMHSGAKIYCIHSAGDLALWAGSLLRFDHPFGLAGVYGFNDPAVENIKSSGGHNADFEDANLSYWVSIIHFRLAQIGFKKE